MHSYNNNNNFETHFDGETQRLANVQEGGLYTVDINENAILRQSGLGPVIFTAKKIHGFHSGITGKFPRKLTTPEFVRAFNIQMKNAGSKLEKD